MLDRIKNDLKEAMKQRDGMKVSTLRMLLSAINYYRIAKQRDLNDEDIISVLSSEAKKRRESIESYQAAKRQDLVDRESKELEIIKSYLPAQLSNEDIEVLVNEAIEKTQSSSISDMGKVMGYLVPKIKGKADGGLVSQLVKQKLSQS